MRSEAAARADFSQIRYAQVWEDADVLLRALDVQPGDVCVSIASAGDNALAMLSLAPARVIALDLSPAQLACLELRVAAYRCLTHSELLELIGSTVSTRRDELYRRCRPALSPETRRSWDARPDIVRAGIGSGGRFEQYFATFRRRVLPLVHSSNTVRALLEPRALEERIRFYAKRWNTWRWRLLFRIFFSRFVMGRLGRDPAFFTYVQGSVADRILERTRYALTTLDPCTNPYLQWILTGRHGSALPYALRPQQFEPIREHLDRLECRCVSLEAFLDEQGDDAIDRYNLSDIFEYVSIQHYHGMLERIIRAGKAGGRLVYWNMLAERRRPASMADRLRPLRALADELQRVDKAFFYSALVVEEIR